MLEDFNKAFHIFQESAKLSFDNWQIWDNILTVSAKCGHFEEVIRAYHRILDIRECKTTSSHPNKTKMKDLVDAKVLGFLGASVVNGSTDSEGESCVKYLSKSLKLFARIASLSPKDGEFYEIYAKLLAFDAEQSEEDKAEKSFKAAQMMQKGCAMYTQQKEWSLSVEGCLKTMNFGLAYADSCLAASCDNQAQSIPQMGSARLTLKSMLAQVKKNHTNIETGEVEDSLRSTYSDVEHKIVELVDRVAALKS